jgi:hypothetical protein
VRRTSRSCAAIPVALQGPRRLRYVPEVIYPAWHMSICSDERESFPQVSGLRFPASRLRPETTNIKFPLMRP